MKKDLFMIKLNKLLLAAGLSSCVCGIWKKVFIYADSFFLSLFLSFFPFFPFFFFCSQGLGDLSMPMNSVRRFTDRDQHYLNSVVKRQSTKFIPTKDRRAKTQAYSGFNGWHMLSSLVHDSLC